MKKKVALVLAALACIAALIFTQPRLAQEQHRLPVLDAPASLFNADYVRFIALGHDGLIADLVLARALSYYGAHYRHPDTLDHSALKNLFRLALELDHDNIDAFLLASNLLSETNPHDAIAILEKGRQYNPANWKLPEMIGFKYYFVLKNSYKAARYYEIAARLPNHPPYVPSLASKFYQESGRLDHALRVLYNFYSTTSDKRLKNNFRILIEKVLAAKNRLPQDVKNQLPRAAIH